MKFIDEEFNMIMQDFNPLTRRGAFFLTTMLVGGCGASIEGRYAAQGEAFLDSITLSENGRAEFVFLNTPSVGTYVVDENNIRLTRPTGDTVLMVMRDDGCMSNLILGTYCLAGDASATANNSTPGSSAADNTNSTTEAYEATTFNGRLRIELLTDNQARMTVFPDAGNAQDMPTQMSFDVPYLRMGNNLRVSVPGEDPMELAREGADFITTMNGETARFVRQ